MGPRGGGVQAQSGAILHVKFLEQQFSFLRWKGGCPNNHVIDDLNFECLEPTTTFQMHGNLTLCIKYLPGVIESRCLDVQHRSAIDDYTEACLHEMRH